MCNYNGCHSSRRVGYVLIAMEWNFAFIIFGLFWGWSKRLFDIRSTGVYLYCVVDQHCPGMPKLWICKFRQKKGQTTIDQFFPPSSPFETMYLNVDSPSSTEVMRSPATLGWTQRVMTDYYVSYRPENLEGQPLLHNVGKGPLSIHDVEQRSTLPPWKM